MTTIEQVQQAQIDVRGAIGRILYRQRAERRARRFGGAVVDPEIQVAIDALTGEAARLWQDVAAMPFEDREALMTWLIKDNQARNMARLQAQVDAAAIVSKARDERNGVVSKDVKYKTKIRRAE